ncbi:MAG: 50S ribosomal protein L11 methyltransferase [Pseudomonadota bacterium]
MVIRATTEIGTGDDAEMEANRLLSLVDEFTIDGEPVLSAYLTRQDGPWCLEVLFALMEESAAHAWLDSVRAAVPALGAFTVDPLAARDWVAESQRALTPVPVGRFTVHGSHDDKRLPPSVWRIRIDAGRAFGTAHHASTAGCLLALERLAKRQPLGTVHDVGTGSGVLAIAADRLGAREVSGVDIDPDAVAVARRNAASNRVKRPIHFAVASRPTEPANVVIANILARPLIKMAPQLAVAAQDVLILSGLRTADEKRIKAVFRAYGLCVERTVTLNDWATITLKPLPLRPRAAAARR